MTHVLRMLGFVSFMCVAATSVADTRSQNGNMGEGPMSEPDRRSAPGPEAGFCVEVKPVCPPGGAAVCLCDMYNMCRWACGAQ